MKFLKLGLASLVASSVLFAGNYNVDASHSNVGFSVKHMMITNVTGKFNDVSGNFEYDEKTNTLKALSGDIIVASINTADEKRDTHLKAEELFDAAKFPKINFNVMTKRKYPERKSSYQRLSSAFRSVIDNFKIAAS